MKITKSIAIGAALFAAGVGVGCGNDDNTGPLGSVDSLVILQRPKRNDMGDIFQYTSYVPVAADGTHARLVKLSPPTADGKLEVLCCDKAGAEFANIDISSYDISFDAKEIVFAGKLADDQRYGLFRLKLETGAVEQIMTDPGRDYVNPIYLPGDKIMFDTNAVVEAGAPQHMDEYERGTTLQVGIINIDGTGEQLGPRNLSHRTFPTLTSDVARPHDPGWRADRCPSRPAVHQRRRAPRGQRDVGSERQLRQPVARRSARPHAEREHDRPLLRCVPAQREGPPGSARVVGGWPRRVGRPRSGRPVGELRRLPL
jgi:hypothetical protein